MGRENALPVQKREVDSPPPPSLSIQFAQYVTSQLCKGLLQRGIEKSVPFKVDGRNIGSSEGVILVGSYEF